MKEFIHNDVSRRAREVRVLKKTIMWCLRECMIKRLIVLIEFEQETVYRKMYEGFLLQLYLKHVHCNSRD